MAGLVPAIHVFSHLKKDVDARDKRGHDEDTWSARDRAEPTATRRPLPGLDKSR
jgi:hypothetical protein